MDCVTEYDHTPEWSHSLMMNFQCGFRLNILDKDVAKDKLKIEVTGPTSKPDCDVQWRDKFQCVECKFTPKEAGNYHVSITEPCGHRLIETTCKLILVKEKCNMSQEYCSYQTTLCLSEKNHFQNDVFNTALHPLQNCTSKNGSV